MIKVEIPTTPVPLDRNTGENNVSGILQQARVPHTEAFQQQFPMNIVMPVIDRHPANLRAESFLKSSNPESILSLYTCSVHKKASALKHSLAVADPVVTGIVNAGLSQTGAGSTEALRSVLRSVFLEELEIVYGDPPPHAAQHRKEVLDLFCPTHIKSWHDKGGKAEASSTGWKNVRRRMILNYFCNSDLTSESIVHHCMYSCCESPSQTIEHFCTYVVFALVPGKCPVFSRKSWVGSDLSFSWYGLLSSFWNLAEKVLVKYTGYVKKEPASKNSVDQTIWNALRGDDEDEGSGLGEWAGVFSSSLVGEDDRHPTEETDRTEDPKPESTWAEFNKGVRRKAGAFASFEFTRDDVTIVKQAMTPGLSLLHRSLHLASAQWSSEQELESACGHGRLYRAVECAKNKFEDMCFSEVKQQMVSLPLALPLSSYNRRCRSMFFRLQATLLCRLEFTVRHQHRGSRFFSRFVGQPMLNGGCGCGCGCCCCCCCNVLVAMFLLFLFLFLFMFLLFLFLFFLLLCCCCCCSWCCGGKIWDIGRTFVEIFCRCQRTSVALTVTNSLTANGSTIQ